MYPATKTFWLEPTEQVAVGLRRYSWSNGSGYDCAAGYHGALHYVGRDHANFDERRYLIAWKGAPVHDDPRWPARCDKCDHRFVEADIWQSWQELIWRRPDTGEEFVLRDTCAPEFDAPAAPPGATWNAHWYHRKGPDGMSLHVLLPNGRTWTVDSEANNCTRKGESHCCWVRHGDPHQANVTVDKDGDTCAAGAGSIQAGDYHGFLVSGVLSAG